MKLDKEKFNKLKQLDRIEFRQKWNNIEEIEFSMTNAIWATLIFTAIFMVGSILDLAFAMLKLSVILIVINIFGYFVIEHLKNKKKEELMREYFKIEVKK